jgi:acetylglutamate kinase
MNVTVLKFGGELLEDAEAIRAAAASIVRFANNGPTVVVHGGGRAIDAELRVRGIEPRFVDGLRITDQPTLDVVISVLAGRANTLLVAAVGAAGGRAVGLTGADAGVGLVTRTATFRSVAGADVDLGLVGEPAPARPVLIGQLLALGYVPLVCSIGVDAQGTLLNVNADTFAGHLAGALGAQRLVIAGTTPGVLNADGITIDRLGADEIDRMAAAGVAHSGMLAKLTACRRALDAGLEDVVIVAGRGGFGINAEGTRIVAGATESRS